MLWWEVVEKAERENKHLCDVCPFDGTQYCRHDGVESPCVSIDDDDDVSYYAYSIQYDYDARAEAAYAEEQLQKKKHERAVKAAKTRTRMQRYCYEEIQTIKRLEKRLNWCESVLRKAQNIQYATAVVNTACGIETPNAPTTAQLRTAQAAIDKLKADIEVTKERYAAKRKEFYAWYVNSGLRPQ